MPAPTPAPISQLARVGAVLSGKYRLDKMIGQGGMGSVWAATHLGVGREVAIKVIAAQFASSREVRRRFDTEAKAAARLKSRHVVQVYDNGELADGTPFIAMELLHGETLHHRIHQKGPIPLVEAVKMITQVCRALAKAHQLGIIHRDIKPENIFLAEAEDDDGEYIVKVLDFGVARVQSPSQDEASTATGALVGTPLFMSPEQARGLRSIDHRTDLYSLGLVAYTMLTGNLPFTSESFTDLIVQICTRPLPRIVAAAPWLPATMDAWFFKACGREPQERFASAQELTDALDVAARVSQPQIPTADDRSAPRLSHDVYPPPNVARPALPAALSPAARFHAPQSAGPETTLKMDQPPAALGMMSSGAEFPMMITAPQRTGFGPGIVVAVAMAALVVVFVLGALAIFVVGFSSAKRLASKPVATVAPIVSTPPAASATARPPEPPPIDSTVAATPSASASAVASSPPAPVPIPVNTGSKPPNKPPTKPGTVDLGY
jgi:serine/threonine-protein kinase